MSSLTSLTTFTASSFIALVTTFARLRPILFASLGLALVLALAAPAQSPAQNLTGSSITLQSGVPTPPSNVSAAYTGAFGQTPIYYWVIARFPAGATVPSAVAIANNTQGSQNLSPSNTVTITWSGVSGATGYDVIRSNTSGFPAPGLIAEVINTTALSVVDTGSALLAYPPAGLVTIQPATATQSVNNLTNAVPQVTMVVNGTTLNLALIQGAGTAGDCVQFAGDGSGRVEAAGAPCGSGGGGGGFYQTVLNNGSALTQRTQLNFVPGTGINISAADSAVPSRTSLTISTSLTQFYQTLLNNGVSLTQRDQLNIIPGTGISISNSDSASPSRTSITINATGGGTGDVVGPASSTTNAIALFGSGTGKLLSDSARLLPTGALVGVGQANTYTTGTQDFSAVSMHVPSGAALAPTSVGHLGYNSTSQRLRYGIGGGTSNTVATQGASSTSGRCAEYDANGALTAGAAACAGTPVAASILNTYANVAAASCTATNSGQIGFLTDVMYQARCNGTAWEWFWKGFRSTLPWANGTWVNQLTATINNTNGTTVMTMPSSLGSTNGIVQVKSLPGATYTVDIGFVMSGSSGIAGSGCGLILRESSSGKLIRIGPNSGSGSPVLTLDSWNSPTSFNGTIQNQTGDVMTMPNAHAFIRIQVSGGNRSYFLSQDGYTWGRYYQEAAGTFMTEDQYGFGCFAGAVTDYGLSMVVFHLAVS